jgi:uncharacterized protein with PIN domain
MSRVKRTEAEIAARNLAFDLQLISRVCPTCNTGLMHSHPESNRIELYFFKKCVVCGFCKEFPR